MINSSKSLCIIIMILLSAFAVSAQDINDLSEYDYVSDFTVKFPLGVVTAGQTIEISVLYKKNPLNPPMSNYPSEWSVTNGTIMEGQGTPKIKVQIDESAKTLTARVEISGVNAVEPVIASGTIEIKTKPEVLEAILFSEMRFSSPNAKYLRTTFQTFANELNNKPSARGYIFIQPKNPRDAEKIKRTIEDYSQKIHFDILRITIKLGMNNNINIMRFYVVPLGAKTPTP